MSVQTSPARSHETDPVLLAASRATAGVPETVEERRFVAAAKADGRFVPARDIHSMLEVRARLEK